VRSEGRGGGKKNFGWGVVPPHLGINNKVRHDGRGDEKKGGVEGNHKIVLNQGGNARSHGFVGFLNPFMAGNTPVEECGKLWGIKRTRRTDGGETKGGTREVRSTLWGGNH